MSHDVGNSGTNMSPVKGTPTLFLWIIGSLTSIQMQTNNIKPDQILSQNGMTTLTWSVQ